MERAETIKTVTNFGWGVSFTTGSDIDGTILNLYKHHEHLKTILSNGQVVNFKSQNGSGDGKAFKTTDEARQWAYEHGFLRRYFHRR